MELRPGYKKTEIGVIPEDWEVKRLGDVADISSGGTPLRTIAEFWNGGIPWITTTQIDGGTIWEAREFISEVGLTRSAAKVYPAGTILLAMYGQGKTRGKAALLGIEAATNQACAGIKIRQNICTDFVFRYLVEKYDFVRSLSNSGNQENLSLKIIADIPLVLPPGAEQTAIAEAMSDADALIAALSRLIAKKRDLRQGAMQRLLTGQTRLPGFTAPWQEKRLGDHVTFLKNGIQSRAQLTLDDPIRYLHYGDIHVSADISLNLRDTTMPRLPIKAAAGLTRLQDGDIVFVDASEDLNGVGKSLEVTGAHGIEAVSGQHTIAARFDETVLADGYKCYLQFMPSFAAHLRHLAAGTKVYATNRKHIASAELRLPEVDEQVAIARVLSDMGAEISALDARLDKTRALKQAMMRALLTGRVRLPVRRDAAPEMKEAAHV